MNREQILSCGNDKMIKLWHKDTSTSIRTFIGKLPCYCIEVINKINFLAGYS